MEFDIQSYAGRMMDAVVSWAPKLLLALVVWIIGSWIIGRISNFVSSAIERSDVDTSLGKFIASIVNIGLKIMLLFTVAGMLGIQTTSFIAIFGALMVGVGMALNGTLGHLASGIMLMVFKPFKVGDLVEIGGGSTGTVEAINAFNTTLETLDNKRIIIANSTVTNNIITNISGQGIVGVELSYIIPFNESIDKARDIILSVGKNSPYILDDPAQGVVVAGAVENGIQLNSRPFCKSEDYWDALFYMQEHVRKAFAAEGISVPYQHITVNQSAN